MGPTLGNIFTNSHEVASISLYMARSRGFIGSAARPFLIKLEIMGDSVKVAQSWPVGD